MANTYTKLYMHVVFSTKERRNLLETAVQPRVFAYIGAIARDNGMVAVEVGGTANHIHALVSISPTVPVSKAVQVMKGSSSKWMNDERLCRLPFAWQQGYAAFSVGAKQVERTVAYIRNQEEHHKTRTFEEELIQFLEANGVEYDPRYLFD